MDLSGSYLISNKPEYQSYDIVYDQYFRMESFLIAIYGGFYHKSATSSDLHFYPGGYIANFRAEDLNQRRTANFRKSLGLFSLHVINEYMTPYVKTLSGRVHKNIFIGHPDLGLHGNLNLPFCNPGRETLQKLKKTLHEKRLNWPAIMYCPMDDLPGSNLEKANWYYMDYGRLFPRKEDSGNEIDTSKWRPGLRDRCNRPVYSYVQSYVELQNSPLSYDFNKSAKKIDKLIKFKMRMNWKHFFDPERNSEALTMRSNPDSCLVFVTYLAAVTERQPFGLEYTTNRERAEWIEHHRARSQRQKRSEIRSRKREENRGKKLKRGQKNATEIEQTNRNGDEVTAGEDIGNNNGNIDQNDAGSGTQNPGNKGQNGNFVSEHIEDNSPEKLAETEQTEIKPEHKKYLEKLDRQLKTIQRADLWLHRQQLKMKNEDYTGGCDPQIRDEIEEKILLNYGLDKKDPNKNFNVIQYERDRNFSAVSNQERAPFFERVNLDDLHESVTEDYFYCHEIAPIFVYECYYQPSPFGKKRRRDDEYIKLPPGFIIMGREFLRVVDKQSREPLSLRSKQFHDFWNYNRCEDFLRFPNFDAAFFPEAIKADIPICTKARQCPYPAPYAEFERKSTSKLYFEDIIMQARPQSDRIHAENCEFWNGALHHIHHVKRMTSTISGKAFYDPQFICYSTHNGTITAFHIVEQNFEQGGKQLHDGRSVLVPVWPIYQLLGNGFHNIIREKSQAREDSMKFEQGIQLINKPIKN